MAENNTGNMVDLISGDFIAPLWSTIWPMIKDVALLETEEELRASLEAGDQLLIVCLDCIAIIRPGDVLWINYVAGKNLKAAWPIINETVNEMAKLQGSRMIAAAGRDAWKRIAPDFKATKQRLYVKEVVI